MRPADMHLTPQELQLLLFGVTDSETSIADSAAAQEAQQHLSGCAVCQSVARKYTKADSLLRGLSSGNKGLRNVDVGNGASDGEGALDGPKRGTDCPAEQSWPNLAAGLIKEDEAARYVSHAAQCDWCGPQLKEAMEDLTQPVTAEEQEALEKLPSASPGWQRAMARKMAAESGSAAVADVEKTAKSKEKVGFGWWPKLVWAGSGLAVVVVAGLVGIRLAREQDVNALLAQAYTEQRTIELRIPGAKYAPMRVERAKERSNTDKSPSLLKAETLISEHRGKPTSPAWLQAKARADILDHHYDSAITTLQQALETQPNSSSLLTDLGSAYYMQAEEKNYKPDYARAVDLLGSALAKSPDDPVVLFNHALACERISLFSKAFDDWEHYLKVDPQSAWSNEARANLQRVKEKKARWQTRTSAPLLSPKDISSLIDANHDDPAAILDQRAERYMETATQSWLLQAYGDGGGSQISSPEPRRALYYLAEILENHHDDSWLYDFLQNLSVSAGKGGLNSLLASDEALRSGRYGLSIELAKKSAREFQRARNQAGVLRASFNLMLAQTFAFKTSDCLRTAAIAIPMLSTTRYRWLQIQTFIQQGLCQYVTPQVDEAFRSTSHGAELAKLFRYPELQLRATAFSAACRRDTGETDRGLHDLINGLETFWQTGAPSIRGENLYSVLFNVAGDNGWHHLEALAIAEKISDFPLKDPVDQAVGWELLAGAEERAGEYKAAQAILRRTASQLTTMPEDPGIILRKAEIEFENAGILLHLGDSNAALAVLDRLRPQFETADGLSQAEYFKTYGEAYLSLGMEAPAEPLLNRALLIAERGLGGLQLEADKLQWSRTQSQIYRDLVEINLKSRSSAKALALWEWYKGASLRVEKGKSAGMFTDTLRSSFAPSEAFNYGLPPGTALVSYALLRNSMVAFVFRDGNVWSHSLQLPGDPKVRVFHFLSLCNDPSSDLDSFNTESRQLYDLLVAPLESDIKGIKAIRFETDGVLDRIPFDLLQGTDGHYLGDRFSVTYSPGLAYGSSFRSRYLSPSGAALIVVASEVEEPSFPPLPEAIEEGTDVATYFRNVKMLSGAEVTRANVLHSLRGAKIFHFVGHAIRGVSQVGLVLGRGENLRAEDLRNLRTRNLQLAVLSACDTASGNEGTFSDVNSIARTLTAAGVPQTLASRWNVDSTVTRKLMRVFYSNLMSGKTSEDSLRAATLTIRKLPGYQHPYYWGSFTVFGN
jgi:tetratricopeptide (TPR) repeat protein